MKTFKLASKIFITGATFAAIIGSQSASAKRYIVTYSSPSKFDELSYQLKKVLSKNEMSVDLFGRSKINLPVVGKTQAEVLATFDHIQTAVVNIQSQKDLEALKNNSDIAHIEEEQVFSIPTPPVHRAVRGFAAYEDKGEITWGLQAIGATDVWSPSPLNSAGEGVEVMVLDSGIDKDHPDLKANFLDGRDLVTYIPPSPTRFGFSFHDLIYPNDAQTLAPIEDEDFEDKENVPYPYFDRNGHGTHTAGTIAAIYDGKGVAGVAPKAKIYAGRVCGKFSCTTTGIISGVNWAIDRKVDVVSMSLGGPMPTAAIREAMDRAYNLGITLVAASGNDGTPQIGYPAGYSSVIAVGAVDRDLKRATFSQYGKGLQIMAPGVEVMSTIPMGTGRESKVSVMMNGQSTLVPSNSFVGSSLEETELVADLVFVGLGKPEEFAQVNAKGKIALIQRGEIKFVEKVENALKAGVSGVVIFNNEPGLLNGAISEEGDVGIPVVMIHQSIGEKVRDALKVGTKVGVKIKTIATDHAAFQGTSMACPHVSGVVALMKSVNPKLTPDQVRSILIQSAKKLVASDPNNEYGAGLVDAKAAVALAEKTR